MERYRRYKDSGVDWIGEIPEGWGVTAVRHVLQLHSGLALSDDQYDVEGDFPVYGGGGVRGMADLWNVQGRTVIVSRQGATCGTTRLIEGKAWITEHALIAYFLNGMHDKRYFAYVLQTMNLGKLSMTAAQPGISASLVQSQHTPVPNQTEQQAIADYLDEKTGAIDEAVARIERSIELLNEYRRSVISEAVTKGLDPTVPMKDSGIDWIGQIPTYWDTKAIKTICSLKTGHTPPSNEQKYFNGDVPWYTPGDINDNKLINSSRKVSQVAVIDRQVPIYAAESTLLVAIGATAGKVGYISESASSNQQITAITPFSCDSKWLFYTMMNERRRLYDLALYTTLPILNNEYLSNYKIVVPSSAEQQAIADYLDKKCNELDSLIAEKQSMLVRLKEYRSALISECVTGKVKVPGVEE